MYAPEWRLFEVDPTLILSTPNVSPYEQVNHQWIPLLHATITPSSVFEDTMPTINEYIPQRENIDKYIQPRRLLP